MCIRDRLKGSILDNVRLGRPQATEAEVLAALKAAQCMDIVEKFPAGIHTVIGTKGCLLYTSPRSFST